MLRRVDILEIKKKISTGVDGFLEVIKGGKKSTRLIKVFWLHGGGFLMHDHLRRTFVGIYLSSRRFAVVVDQLHHKAEEMCRRVDAK